MTYAWLTGHVRNVGDSALRRPYCSAIRRAGRIRAYTADPDGRYDANIGLQADESFQKFLPWYIAFIKDTVVGRPGFAFNAGEFGVTRSYFFGMVLLLPWLAILRLKGAPIVWVGSSIGSTRKGFMWPFDLLLRMATFVHWRDDRSQVVMAGGSVMPDWAFALGSAERQPNADRRGGPPYAPTGDLEHRRSLAVCLRGDREYPSELWLAAVRVLADRLDLRPVVVVQVEEDTAMARMLAKDLDGSLVQCSPVEGHRWAEETVRSAYRTCRLVISDRLHGLIIGATEGAVPLAWCAQRTDKVKRHFDTIGAGWVSRNLAESLAGFATLCDADLVGMARLNDNAVAEARERVQNLAVKLTEHLIVPNGKRAVLDSQAIHPTPTRGGIAESSPI